MRIPIAFLVVVVACSSSLNSSEFVITPNPDADISGTPVNDSGIVDAGDYEVNTAPCQGLNNCCPGQCGDTKQGNWVPPGIIGGHSQQ